MNWNVTLLVNELSCYEFVAEDGKIFICKFNSNNGTLRIKFKSYHAVIVTDIHHLFNRKYSLHNVYGSEIGLVTKNMWHENTGNIHFNHSSKKINYKIDHFSSLIEITIDHQIITCNLSQLPHPGKEKHFTPVLLALSWIVSVPKILELETAA